MTEKEFRKLRSLDLIQILLTQGNEEARLQEELEKQKAHLAELREYNDSLKTALNDKDALIETLKQDLNQSDEDIRNLRAELKELYADKLINLENIGSLTEVAKRVNYIFETAQREAEEYLAHPERICSDSDNSSMDAVMATPELPVKKSADTDGVTQGIENTTTESADDQEGASVSEIIDRTDDETITNMADVSGMNNETKAESEAMTTENTATEDTTVRNTAAEDILVENMVSEDTDEDVLAKNTDVEDSAVGNATVEDKDVPVEDMAVEDVSAKDESVENEPIENIIAEPVNNQEETADNQEETPDSIQETAPNHQETISEQSEIIPEQSEAISGQQETAPGAAETVQSEKSMVTAQAAVEKHETSHYKKTAKKAQSNKNWLKKLIGRMK